ncbi:MAG TPA: hypothetical protein VMY39_06555 [Planctomycetota bacterium]|nr:hypothetical protein [Planctomycetota bacterium]
MSSQVILSCPFCHHRAEYHDAPPGSTVRCQDCDCIFRVPTVSRRRPGSVVRGEEIRAGRMKKRLVLLVVVLAVLGVGYGAWQVIAAQRAKTPDPYKGIVGLEPEGTPRGTVQRFLEAWKMSITSPDADYLDLMLHQCLTIDHPKTDWAEDKFKSFLLVEYEIFGFKPIHDGFEAKVNITVEHPKTHVKSRGEMKPRLYIEKIPDENKEWHEVWRISLQTTTPKYQ